MWEKKFTFKNIVYFSVSIDNIIVFNQINYACIIFFVSKLIYTYVDFRVK